MDTLILQEKLEALRRCVRRIEERRADSAGELGKDLDRQDIVTLNLTRAVQLCVDMAVHVIAESEQMAPQTMGEAFEGLAKLGLISEALSLRMKAAVGFRNIAIHQYQSIDWDIVHAITWKGLEDFRNFARAMATLTDNGPNTSV
ncbi:type VII toxin-antitoxin system HepT family RNase toxin [Nitrococcus mobilis]|uniref:DUF86 domain-containing protein n=1 Tax=Nitrococcus mobilis Nb-231 TaxID=314278 RepID=A4BME7_9GAMM|nr:DUF86 domain-containing protein [Nitrococcus mobilis]EAR23485.1 hypothetical protein NB231_16733 [Nitrococcus mobilis Nb-231]